MHSRIDRSGHARRGTVLVMAIVTLVLLAGMTLAFLSLSMSANREVMGAGGELRARYLAEAAIAEGLAAKREAGRVRVDALASLAGAVAFGEGEYQMDVTWGEDDPAMGDDLIRMNATGRTGRAVVAIEMLGRLEDTNIWLWGAFGDVELSMDSNAHVDSYDSSLGGYAAQQVNGSGSDAWADEQGSVGSNGDILLSSNTNVYGDATCGPISTTSLAGNAAVSGSTAPNVETVALPALTVPSFGSLGNLSYGGSTHTIPAGNREYDSFVVGGNHTVTILGPATIVVDDLRLESNSQLWIDSANGPVSIYVREDFVMDSNTIMAPTSHVPAHLSLNLATENLIDPTPPELSFDSNTILYGTIYAPNAWFEFDSNTQLYGAVIARQVHLDSNSFVHFDESLLTPVLDSPGEVEVLWWRTRAEP